MRLIEGEILELKHTLLDMAELVQSQLEHLEGAITTLDPDLVEKVRKNEKLIDRFDNKIDKRCQRLIALYHPVANDLRFVFSVLKINSYLENIGDSTYTIVRNINRMEEAYSPKLLNEINFSEMLALARQIVRKSLLAFFQNDSTLAREVFFMDDRIDEINRNAYEVLVQKIQKKPKQTPQLVRLIFIVKNLEKIGDNAVGVAEESIFHLEGVMYRHSGFTKHDGTDTRPYDEDEDAAAADAQLSGGPQLYQ